MKSPISICACSIPIIIGSIGLLYAFTTPVDQYDMIGAGLIIRVALTLLIASLVSVIFSFWSYQRNEPKASSTLWLSIPSACLLLSLGFYLIENYVSEAKSKTDKNVEQVAVANQLGRVSSHLFT